MFAQQIDDLYLKVWSIWSLLTHNDCVEILILFRFYLKWKIITKIPHFLLLIKNKSMSSWCVKRLILMILLNVYFAILKNFCCSSNAALTLGLPIILLPKTWLLCRTWCTPCLIHFPIRSHWDDVRLYVNYLGK